MDRVFLFGFCWEPASSDYDGQLNVFEFMTDKLGIGLLDPGCVLLLDPNLLTASSLLIFANRRPRR